MFFSLKSTLNERLVRLDAEIFTGNKAMTPCDKVLSSKKVHIYCIILNREKCIEYAKFDDFKKGLFIDMTSSGEGAKRR